MMRRKIKDQEPEIGDISQSDMSESHDPHKKISKLKKVLIDIFLISDIKNRKIRPELRSIKHDIVDNLDGNCISSDRINRFFWAYATIGKNIYIPPHLEKLISNYNVQITYDDKIREMNLKNYLIIIKDIRSLLVYLGKLQSDIQRSINFEPNQQIYTEGERSIAAEQQQIYAGLYNKKLTTEIVDIQKKIATGTFDLTDVMKLYVFSLNLGKTTHFSFKRYLTQEHMQKEFMVGNINITLKDFIRILKDLKIDEHQIQ